MNRYVIVNSYVGAIVVAAYGVVRLGLELPGGRHDHLLTGIAILALLLALVLLLRGLARELRKGRNDRQRR